MCVCVFWAGDGWGAQTPVSGRTGRPIRHLIPQYPFNGFSTQAPVCMHRSMLCVELHLTNQRVWGGVYQSSEGVSVDVFSTS